MARETTLLGIRVDARLRERIEMMAHYRATRPSTYARDLIEAGVELDIEAAGGEDRVREAFAIQKAALEDKAKRRRLAAEQEQVRSETKFRQSPGVFGQAEAKTR